MAARTIAIKIVVDNKEAINSAKALVTVMNGLNDITNKNTQLQNGLTNSFIKGNLAARAISVTYGGIKDSLKALAVEAVNFEHNLTKLSAIGEVGTASMASLESTIRSLALSTNQSQNSLAKAALEMTKMGLSGSQVEEALGGVAKLARALDEDLVTTGETVVKVMNAYGFSAGEANKVTNQLAYTVKVSALDIETFGTAFSYVGGTAKAAGVSFEELQGAMDVLSNAGIKASTVGTALRRIIADLSDEHSKAAKAAGGTIQSYGGLSNALEALKKQNIDVSGLTEIFGRTASSTAAIAIRYASAIHGLGEDTKGVGDITSKMSDQMNTTLLSALQGITVAWSNLGIEISKSTGFLATFARHAKEALEGIAEGMALSKNIASFKEAEPEQYKKANAAALKRMGKQDPFLNASDDEIAVSKEFASYSAKVRQAGIDAKHRENIISELQATFSQGMKLPKGFDPDKNLDVIQPKDTAAYAYLERLYGADKEGFAAAVKAAKIQFASKLEYAGVEAFDTDSLKKGKKAKKEKEPPLFQNLGPTDIPENYGAPSDSAIRGLFNRVGAEVKANKSPQGKAEDALKNYFAGVKESVEPAQQAVDAMKLSMDALSTSSQIFGDTIVNTFLGHKDAFSDFQDAFGNMAKKFVSELIAMQIRLLAFKAAIGIFGLFTAGAAAPGLAAPGAVSNGFGEMVAGATMAASGTDKVVNKPTLFMAGESGKERVQVTPRAKMGSNGGNGLTVIIQGDVMDGAKFTEAVEMAQKKLNKRNV